MVFLCIEKKGVSQKFFSLIFPTPFYYYISGDDSPEN